MEKRFSPTYNNYMYSRREGVFITSCSSSRKWTKSEIYGQTLVISGNSILLFYPPTNRLRTY